MSYLGLLRRRPVLVLWSSAALSVLGDRLYGLAVMWVVYTTTGSASLMGLVAVVESLPYIVLGTWGRQVVAQFSSFGALGWIDAARAVAAGAIPLLWASGHGGMAGLLALVAVLGTLGALFDPNLGALVPDLVAPGQVRQVTALLDLTTRIAAIAGPGCVGLILLVVSDVQLFALDAGTFVISALALWWLRGHTRRAVAAGSRPPEPAGPTAAVAAWPLLRRHPDVAVAIGLHGAGFLVAAVSAVGLPALLTVRLGQGAAGYGLVLAAIGAGALTGNLLIGSLRAGRWLMLYCAAWAVTGLALIGMSSAHTLPLVLAFGFLSGLATPAAAVTLRARLAGFDRPARLRLITVDQTLIRSAGTLGMLTLPLVVDAAPGAAFAGAGTFLIVAAAAAALAGRRVVTAMPQPAGPPVPAAEPAAASTS